MDGKVATTVGLLPTEEIRTDGADNVYIIESASRIIRKINTATGIINTVAGGGNLTPADGIRATDASFVFLTSPHLGFAVDKSGNVYLSFNNRFFKIDPNTGILKSIMGDGTPAVTGDGGLAINAQF